MATILIVDDDETNRVVLSKLLTHEGYQVVEAADGASAFEQVRTERPDLALVDLLMPVMDGFEFVHKLRAEGGDMARLPVVFITAAFLPVEVTALARSCGVSHVLPRPSTFEEVLRVTEEALRAAPPSADAPPRPEFRLELLRLLTSTVSKSFRTVIPLMGELADCDDPPGRSDGSPERPAVVNG